MANSKEASKKSVKTQSNKSKPFLNLNENNKYFAVMLFSVVSLIVVMLALGILLKTVLEQEQVIQGLLKQISGGVVK
jgi:hypothetical protein